MLVIGLRTRDKGGVEAMTAAMAETATYCETMQQRILIADDQKDVLDALQLLLKGQGYLLETVSNPADLLAALAQREFDLLLMDLNYARDTTSGREGLDVLGRLKEMADAPPVVAMTGWATVGLAVSAMQHGVSDFVEKPWDNSRLLEILEKQIELGRERRVARQRAKEEKKAQEEVIHHLQEAEREIAEAKAIQERLVPRELPQMAGYEIASSWQSARTVSGDYFDVLTLGKDTLGLCIADVAGKGIPAALLMSNLQAAVHGLSSPSLSPDVLCNGLNTLVWKNTHTDRFITLFYARLDGPARLLRYSNAGHNAPIVVHTDGSHERLEEGGGVLGVFEEQDFGLGTAKLTPGDRLVLFTDGVTEANNTGGEEFGEERLLRLLKNHRALPAAELKERIARAISEFSGGHLTDDATLLVVAVGA
ncbi:MAG TPA: SpoIIE family protein phosphatase [Candidatus Acidoferrum sp.]|nr:SpoIIE family protein phosphatase [Candidatus Acidoferrum sp.]